MKEEDFLLFDNIIRIDASENQLPFRMSIEIKYYLLKNYIFFKMVLKLFHN